MSHRQVMPCLTARTPVRWVPAVQLAIPRTGVREPPIARDRNEEARLMVGLKEHWEIS